MAKKPQRTPTRYGHNPKHAVDAQSVTRDTRPLLQQIGDIFVEPAVPATIICLLCLLPLVIPGSLYFVLPLGLWVWRLCTKHPDVLPMNLPEEANAVDLNDPFPGRLGARKARGKAFLGNDMDESWELWAAFEILTRHQTYLGTTGAGKTEALLSLFANYLGFGGSCIYNDAKGTIEFVWQSYTITRFFGRDDDFYTLNYIQGNTSRKPDPATRLSNDTNPFSSGTHSSLTQMMVGLIPSSGANDPNKLFSERAIGLISSMMPSAVELRDSGQLLIDPGVIRRYMEFTEFVSLADMPVSPEAKEPIYAYMASLSGYLANKPTHQQPEEVTRQFGFAQAYFTRALSSLSDTYGNIYMTQLGEVDPVDVVTNNRILVTVLPAMEKSDEELSNLGRINLTALRNAIATGLGPKVEGTRKEVLDSLSTATNYPTGIILDELAYQAVPGIAITAAQARGLMFAMCFASQEFSSLLRTLDKEAYQLIANSRLKVIMAQEDAGETLKLIYEVVGEARQMESDGHGIEQSIDYTDKGSATVRSVRRIDLMDLRSLNEGEAFLIYQDKIIRSFLFWHGFDKKKDTVRNFEVRRKMKTRTSKRGLAMQLYSPLMAHNQKEVDIWLKHLEVEDLVYDDSIPKALKPSTKLVAIAEEKALSPLETALAFIAHYGTSPVTSNVRKEQEKKDTAEDETSPAFDDKSTILGNLHGGAFGTGEEETTFDDLDGPTEGGTVDADHDALAAADAVLSAALDDLESEISSSGESLLEEADKDNPISIESIFADHDAATGGDDEDAPLFKRKAFSAASTEGIERIGTGVAYLERLRGEDEEKAAQSKGKAVDAIRKAIEYPTEPFIVKGKDFTAADTADIIGDWIDGDD